MQVKGLDDCAAYGFIQRRKASGNPSLAHSITFLLAKCLNASIKTFLGVRRESGRQGVWVSLLGEFF
jgi:hypothetical protein